MFYHFKRVSENAKTGPIPTVMASPLTCPASCSLRGAGCYAESGPIAIHWRRLAAGTTKNQVTFDELLGLIRSLPKRIRWRYGTAGDLPPEPADVLRLADANAGRDAIVFTHGRDFDTYREAGRRGMHINLSADSPAEVDTLPADLSAVCVMPSNTTRGKHYTPAGRPIAVCPATYTDHVDCASCGLCAKARTRNAVIGFPAHGSRRKVIDRRLA